MIDVLQKQKSPSLFVDGDTMFLKSPQYIFNFIKKNNDVFLHYTENTLKYKTEKLFQRTKTSNLSDHVKKLLPYALNFHENILKNGYITAN